jgi:PBP1b-binding outer membrane lipoprotein LpoB
MKMLLILTMAVVIIAGCSQAKTSPSPSATATAAATNTPGTATSPAVSPTDSIGNGSGGTGTATSTPSSGATSAPVNLPSITKEQMDKLDINTTYADLVKVIGTNIQPIKEQSGKKTYELKVSNVTNQYVDFTYLSDGKMSEKNVFFRG